MYARLARDNQNPDDDELSSETLKRVLDTVHFTYGRQYTYLRQYGSSTLACDSRFLIVASAG